MVKCWDLEANKVIRHYHGHLSGVYSLSLHPTLDVLVTSGRDASARVWDMRTKAQIHVLAGHSATVADVKCQESDPQVITGSMDSTVRYVEFFSQINALADTTLVKAVGPSSWKDNGHPHPPQKICKGLGNSPDRIFLCIRFRRR
jgi:WD40 repeat protein